MSRDDGGPAFPQTLTTLGGSTLTAQIERTRGLSLRDYFAAKAMQVFCHDSEGFVDDAQRAACAYAMADAMLAERSKP